MPTRVLAFHSFCRPVLTAFLFVLAGAAVAKDGLSEAMQDWADRHAMHPVVLVALDADGQIIAQVATGDAGERPLPLASISKTIAGQCVLHAVASGMIGFETTTGEVLDWPEPQGAITVAQLLTHASGLGPDATQTDIMGLNLTDPHRIAAIVDGLADRPLQNPVHAYNNENYLVLEAMMWTVLGEDPVEWCLQSAPALAAYDSFAPNDRTFALGFAGGLEASAADLARFFQVLTVAEEWPRTPMGGPNEYGPGIIIQEIDIGTNLFHAGGLCLVTGMGFGSFAGQLANGASIAVMYSGCAQEKPLREMNALIIEHLATP